MRVTSDRNLGTVRVRQVHLLLSPTLLSAQAKVAITFTPMRSNDTFGGEGNEDETRHHVGIILCAWSYYSRGQRKATIKMNPFWNLR